MNNMQAALIAALSFTMALAVMLSPLLRKPMKNNSEELITYKITVTDEGQEAPVVITHQEDYARTSQCYITEYIETINDTIEHYETSDTPPEYDEVEDALITYEKHITEINGVKHEITVR